MQTTFVERIRSKKISATLPILILALFISACQLPEGLNIPQSPLLAAFESQTGLIAYVGIDGNIYTIDQAGDNRIAFTDDAQNVTQDSPLFRVYQLPGWSPNSEKLAFFRTELNSQDSSIETTVFSSSVGDTPEAKELYSTSNQIPIYSYWAPDSDQLAFLSFNQTARAMLFNIVDQEGQHQVVDAGQPYYWGWAPDSKRMIIHAGSKQSPTPERVSFLDLTDDGQVLESVLDQQASFYQAPVWSPDGEWILLAIIDGDQQSLVLADRFGNIESKLLEFDETIGFGFSPDGNKVAAIVGSPTGNGLLVGPMHVFDLETPEEVFITEEDNVMSFFWAPNSDDLAYFPIEVVRFDTDTDGSGATGQQPVVLVNLQAYTHSSGETRQLLENFLPTEQFFTVLSVFNQYQQSATIWSPDSQNLVVTAETPEPLVLIVSSSGGFEPRAISNGVLAFWSWE